MRETYTFQDFLASVDGENQKFVSDLHDSMVRSIQDAPVCKRQVNPAACNQKCSMGCDFILKGKRLQRCRNNAFMFLLDEESRPHVKLLLLHEDKAAAQV